MDAKDIHGIERAAAQAALAEEQVRKDKEKTKAEQQAEKARQQQQKQDAKADRKRKRQGNEYLSMPFRIVQIRLAVLAPEMFGTDPDVTADDAIDELENEYGSELPPAIRRKSSEYNEKVLTKLRPTTDESRGGIDGADQLVTEAEPAESAVA
jgi:hypothetical protein